MTEDSAGRSVVDRRTFLLAAGVGTVALARSGFAGWPANRLAPRLWTWVHGGRARALHEWRAAFRRVRAAGIEAVLVSGGDTAVLAAAAHHEGLEFHRWIWVLNRSGDEWVKENHPEWFSVSRSGDSSLVSPPYVPYYQWVCPTRGPVRAYLAKVVDEIARDPRVDGVHLDYIRHPDVILPKGLWAKYDLVQDREYSEFDFCYCDVCRSTFERRYGRDPVTLPDPPADLEWRRFRWDGVTGVVRQLAETVHARGKPITAAVFPTPTIARRLVRQSWDEWPLDAVFPMLYHEFYEETIEWVGRSAGEGVAALAGARPLYAGLYLPSLSPENLAAGIRLAQDAGAAGAAIFEMEGLSDSHLEALRRAAAKRPG